MDGDPAHRHSDNIEELATDEADAELSEAYPAEKTRQGEIALRHAWSRAIFFSALALIVIALVIWRVLRL
jgi:hypothetical protein